MEIFASVARQMFFYLAAILLLVIKYQSLVGAQGIGVNYGLLGNNLPPPEQVIALYKSKNIQRLRLFDPNQGVLQALRGSGIEVVLGVVNLDLPKLASDPSFTQNWVNTNVVQYAGDVHFRYVAAGNEVIPSELAQYVLPAMQSLDNALKAAGLAVPVSTSVSMAIIGVSYPPSAGEFSPSVSSIMVPILQFLGSKGYPLLCNVYPYFAYVGNLDTIRLEYATFSTTEAVVTDGQLAYTNLFSAMVDSIYSAIEKSGTSVEVVISETGWPSAENGDIATVGNAQTYNNKLIAHVTSNAGTPKKPGKPIETYIFAMFNENLKPAGIEQHWGLFYPDMTPVYDINLSVSGDVVARKNYINKGVGTVCSKASLPLANILVLVFTLIAFGFGW